MEVLIPIQFQKVIKAEELIYDSNSVEALLIKLCADFPELQPRLFSKTGELNKFINFYINDEDIRFLQGVNTKLLSNDVVSIIPAVAGG